MARSLAGLSDDDPARITTYSILGAKFGYRLLWVLAVSTLALIVFHELGARMGVVTKKGLLALVRDHFGPRGATFALTALVAGGRQPRHPRGTGSTGAPARPTEFEPGGG